MLAEQTIESLRDRVLLLRSLDSLRPLDEESLALMAEHARVRRFRAGEALLTEGRPVEIVYVVTAGQVTVTRKGRRMAVVPRGGGVGFTAMLGRDPNGVLAVADLDTLVVEIPAAVMLDVYEQEFAYVRNVMRLQASGLLEERQGLPADPDHPPPLELGTWRDHEPTLVERLLAVHRMPLFASASLDAAIEILRHAVPVRYPAGAILWQIGDPPTFQYRIDHGHVRCTNAAGRSVDVGAGFMIGLMDCLAEEPRACQARAETPVIGYRSSIETLLAVLQAHFDLAMEYLAVLVRQRLP